MHEKLPSFDLLMLTDDDLVIGDQKVALPYKEWLADLGVNVSMPGQ